MKDIYNSGKYLEMNATWHEEDSSWKAKQILDLLRKNKIKFHTLAEVGCGAGGVISAICRDFHSENIRFSGFDISPQAIKIAQDKTQSNLTFKCQDIFCDAETEFFDILLVVDVFEHVSDYILFLKNCQRKAKYKIYHIPLDLHVSSVLRNTFIKERYTLGHIHYFTAESALAVLQDTQHEIIDLAYTNAAFGLFAQHPSFKRAIANIPRWMFSKFSVSLTARLFGGYSLLVLTK